MSLWRWLWRVLLRLKHGGWRHARRPRLLLTTVGQVHCGLVQDVQEAGQQAKQRPRLARARRPLQCSHIAQSRKSRRKHQYGGLCQDASTEQDWEHVVDCAHVHDRLSSLCE